MWIDPIFESLKAKTSRHFSVMLLTENELIGSLAETDLQAINLQILLTNFMSHFLEGCKVSFYVVMIIYISILHLYKKLLQTL